MPVFLGIAAIIGGVAITGEVLGAGKAYAKNVTNATIDLSVDVINRALQRCQGTISAQQLLDISRNKGSTITVNNSGGSIYVVTDQSCVQHADFDTQLSQELNQTIQQAAEAISQNLALGGGSDSNNLTNDMINISAEVKNVFNQTCSSIIYTNQKTLISDNKNSTIVLSGDNDWTITINEVQQCVQTATAKTEAAQKATTDIDQKAKSKVEDAIGFIAVVILIILLVVLYMGGKAMDGIFKVVIVLIILLAIYMFLAYMFKWMPFNGEKPKHDPNKK